MSGHAVIITCLTVAAELSIAVAAGTHLRARRRADQQATCPAAGQAAVEAAELRAQAVDDAIATDDRCALLVALGLIPDPELADLPARDAAELQAVIYPSDITGSIR